MNYIKKSNVSLARFTSLNIGGIVNEVIFPLNQDGAVKLLQELKSQGKRFFVLGGGSNVVVRDEKLDYSVIITTHLAHHRFQGATLVVESGLASSMLAELAAKHSLTGLEFLYGLPGSIGGAVFMNAKAYENEMSFLVEKVKVYDYVRDEVLDLDRDSCVFSYKKSIFQEQPYFILEITLNLRQQSENLDIFRRMEQYKHDRKEKGHFFRPSAGCTFKNNHEIGIPTGKLIDDLGLKGYREGNIQVSEKHGNFLVNNGGGTYREYLNLVNMVKDKVREAKGIELECEVQFLPK